MRALAAVFVAAAVGGGPAGIARADKIAVPAPRVAPGGTALAAGLGASIAGGLASLGHEPISGGALDRALASSPAVAGCDTDLCLARVAVLAGARAAVRGTVELLGSANYTFRLELVDAAQRRTIARVDDTCPICTAREANEAISRAAAALGRKLAPAAPSPAIAAATPPAPSPPRRYTHRGRVLLGLGIATTVLGTGAIAGGATLLALDGREHVAVDPITMDPVSSRFEGKIPGAVLLAGGGLLLVGSGVLFWRASLARAP